MLRPVPDATLRPSLHQQVSICLLAAMHGHFWRHLDARLAELAAEADTQARANPNVIDMAARRALPGLTVASLLNRPTGDACLDYRRGALANERWQDRLDDRLLDWSAGWIMQTAGCSRRRAYRILDLLSEAFARQGLDETRWQQSRREMTLAQLRGRQTPTSR